MTRLSRFLPLFLFVVATPCLAQTVTPPPEPPLRRWFEFQTFTLYTRYRFIESNAKSLGSTANSITSNDLQYRETIRARVNFDAKRRYTLTLGTASGNSFISSWDNTGLGINDADYHNHYLKQLFAAAIPVPGLELQYGGLYITRGENTEFGSYDDDGYAMGGRVTVRRPKLLYVDDLTVTRGSVGPSNRPSVHDRWTRLDDPDYTQVLVAKRFSPMVSGSLDYSRQTGVDTVRAAVALRFAPTAAVNTIRYEQYRRLNARAANGFVLTAERPVTKWVRLQAGVASIDQFYGGLNADRIQRGRRVFAIANVPLVGPLAAAFFATQAFHAPYSISNRTRFDAVLSYDLLRTLRDTGVF